MLPVSAGTLPAPSGFRLNSSNGYLIRAVGLFNPRGGPGAPLMLVTRKASSVHSTIAWKTPAAKRGTANPRAKPCVRSRHSTSTPPGAAARLLAPWQTLEPISIRPYESGEIAAGVAAARQFIASRPGELAAWLGSPQPKPAPGERLWPGKGPSPSPGTGTPTGTSDSPGPEPAALVPALRFGRVAVKGENLIVRLAAFAGGEVHLRGTIDTRGGTLGACSATATAASSGPLTPRCPLEPTVRRRLEARWLMLHLLARFSPPTGTPENIAGIYKVPRSVAESSRHWPP